MTDLTTIRLERGDDRITTLVLDDPDQSVNTMHRGFADDLVAAVEQLANDQDLAGVIVTSAKDSFFAGGDLRELIAAGPDDAAEVSAQGTRIKTALRQLETLGKPVVAAINGAALGGGLEIALACHHRIALDNPKSRIGLPEVTLGLLPGGGGVVRVTRMLGVVDALLKVLVQGQQLRVAKAAEVGLVDDIADTPEAMLDAARAWIAANPEVAQPWDQPGWTLPGGAPGEAAFMGMAPAIAASLRSQLKGAHMDAPHHIMCAAYESAQVPIDRAFEIETRYFTDLVCNSPQSVNMTQAFFFDLQAINKGASRPEGIERRRAEKVAILGAGMMGAGIAYVCAKAGMEVVLKDVEVAAAQKGKGYSERLVATAVDRGRSTAEAGEELLARIHPTADVSDLAGCDLVIEAVFERTELKHRVFGEVEGVVADDALLCSNTSTLPITSLAEGVERHGDFVGLHFFSPVDKMPLVEIIRGQATSDEAVARAIDVVQQIAKTPIVVNDSRGFFTSRVIGTFLNEATAALAEGVSPVRIERAGEQAGYPAPPLQLLDELTLTLPRTIAAEVAAAAEADGIPYEAHPGLAVIDAMVTTHGREGRASGAGFYDYDADGARTGLWPGLADHFGGGDADVPLGDLVERMLFAEALETVHCIDEGVITSFADINIGSIFGIGFPAWTGGVAQYVDQYPGGTTGFVARCKELADRYGDRFTPPASLIAKAESGEPLRPRG